MKLWLLLGLTISTFGYAKTTCINSAARNSSDVKKIIIEGDSPLLKINFFNNLNENVGEFLDIASETESNPFYTLETFDLKSEKKLKITISRHGCGRGGCDFPKIFTTAEYENGDYIANFICAK